MDVIEKFKVILEFQTVVENGEVTTECTKRSISKITNKPLIKKDSYSEPILVLDSNKYCLNAEAVELMQIESDCKLDIKYEKKDGKIIPVIGSDESFGTHSGCKLTKSLTVSCRGSKNKELAKHGTEFTIIPHETKDGIFILKSKNGKNEDLANIIEEPKEDVSIQDLIDEVDSSIFQL